MIVALLSVSWPIAYAYDSVKAADITVTIVTADASAVPHRLKPSGYAIGSVNPGELRVNIAVPNFNPETN
jgi:hypothetical protein